MDLLKAEIARKRKAVEDLQKRSVNGEDDKNTDSRIKNVAGNEDAIPSSSTTIKTKFVRQADIIRIQEEEREEKNKEKRENQRETEKREYFFFVFFSLGGICSFTLLYLGPFFCRRSLYDRLRREAFQYRAPRQPHEPL
jgi:hypothetical protein